MVCYSTAGARALRPDLAPTRAWLEVADARHLTISTQLQLYGDGVHGLLIDYHCGNPKLVDELLNTERGSPQKSGPIVPPSDAPAVAMHFVV